MREWKDTKGKTWFIDLTVAVVRRVQKETGFHLAKVIEVEEVAKLKDDELLFSDLLWSIHREDAKELELSREQFESRLSGDCIMQACDAMLFAVTDFLSDRRKGEIFRQILTTFNEMQAKKAETVREIIDKLPLNQLNEKSADVPDSLESIQAVGHSQS